MPFVLLSFLLQQPVIDEQAVECSVYMWRVKLRWPFINFCEEEENEETSDRKQNWNSVSDERLHSWRLFVLHRRWESLCAVSTQMNNSPISHFVWRFWTLTITTFAPPQTFILRYGILNVPMYIDHNLVTRIKYYEIQAKLKCLFYAKCILHLTNMKLFNTRNQYIPHILPDISYGGWAKCRNSFRNYLTLSLSKETSLLVVPKRWIC